MNSLEKAFATTFTFNGDKAYTTTGDHLIDILFYTSYLEKNLNEVKIGDSEIEKLFSMFIRDPRYGLGRRDLGRELMRQSKVAPEDIVKAGRYDDLYHIGSYDALNYLFDEISKGNVLAKKWAPRLTGKDKAIAKNLCHLWKMTQKDYRKFIKCPDTVEYKMSYVERDSHPLVEDIDFSKVPSLAMIKYFNTWNTNKQTSERFQEYIRLVSSGKKKMNVSTTNVYDIYKNRERIDADLFFNEIEKINISCIPIVDTSGSMIWQNDAMGKALSIGHYLSKCSSYCNGYVIPFSARPHLMKIQGENYIEEIESMHTGDCSNTDLGAVMDILSNLDVNYPEYLIILSDMQFDEGSSCKKDKLMKDWKKKGIQTKIIWWNFNSITATAPETDDYGNIFLSGYSPQLLKYLEVGFDSKAFLKALLENYAKAISK